MLGLSVPFPDSPSKLLVAATRTNTVKGRAFRELMKGSLGGVRGESMKKTTQFRRMLQSSALEFICEAHDNKKNSAIIDNTNFILNLNFS